jgi:integration host factor subunit beta
MNRSELIDVLKEEASINRKDAETIVQVFFDAISDALNDDGRIEIRGFGSFSVKEYRPYVGRNPKSGEKIEVSPKRLPFFRVGKELKSLVDAE